MAHLLHIQGLPIQVLEMRLAVIGTSYCFPFFLQKYSRTILKYVMPVSIYTLCNLSFYYHSVISHSVPLCINTRGETLLSALN
jgi:hypothetical protein